MIVREPALGDSIRIHGQESCESQRDVSTSEYLLRKCHIVTASTALLPTVTREYSSVLSLSNGSRIQWTYSAVSYSPFAIWVNLRMLLSTRFFGGFTIPWGS